MTLGSDRELQPDGLGVEPPLPSGHAFISYVREDSRRVDALQHRLEEAGILIWRDTSDLWPGEDWRARIRDAITGDALAFIACFSDRSVARDKSFQNEELALALDQLRQRRPGVPWLIPVRFDDCAIPGYDIGGGRTLDALERIDMFGDGQDEAVSRLVDAVRRIIGQSRGASVATVPSGTRSPARTGPASSRRAGTGRHAGGQAQPARADDVDGHFMDAVSQLGSGKAPVRLGGLHALGRLGQAHPDLRRTVVDVICAYLRMPYIPPDESSAPGSPGQPGRAKELQVRLTAQRILAEHLRDVTCSGERHDGPVPEAFWPGISLIDLTGAHLVDFNLSGCRVDVIECNRAAFTGESLFRALLCDLGLFQGAAFEFADFRGATFVSDAWFSGSEFIHDAWFHGDEFYPSARFGRHADFRNVTFRRRARFEKVTFGRSSDFTGMTCKEGARAINLRGSLVQHPDAVNRDASKAPSNWPPGWGLEPGPDGAAAITWRG